MYSKCGRDSFFFLFFISFSAFSYELLLTRIFSILMWYHFASLAIGLAMLGLGAGGVLSYLGRDRINGERLEHIVFFYLLSLLFIHAFFFYIHKFPDGIVPYLTYFHQPYFQPFQRGLFYTLTGEMVFTLILGYLILMLPFFFAGVTIASLFRLGYREAQKLYFADMAGAGLASLFVALILNVVSPMNLLSFFVLLGALFFVLRKKFIMRSAFLALLAIIFLILGVFYKLDELPIARGKVVNDIIFVRWNAFSRVILYPIKGEERSNPFGQSPYYRGYIPEQWGLLVDDTGYTTVSEEIKDDETKEFFRWNLISLPYVLRKDEVLIIGPGGGKDINCARAMGVKDKDIYAVELNPLVVTAVNDVLGDKTQRLYSKVNTFVREGRSFLEKERKQFGILQATSVYGRIPPASGIFTFAEDNLYTKEAFYTYFSRLKEGGLLALSRFIYEQTVPKMVLLAMEALKSNNYKSPEKSIFLAKERGLALLLVKKGYFSYDEVKRLLNFCDEKGFTVLYEPYGLYENSYSALIKDVSSHLTLELPTDDRPFYYYNLSKKAFLSALIFANDRFEEKGLSILKFFLFLSSAFVVLIVIMPLLKNTKGKGSRASLSLSISFLSLGIGYIMVEIILIKSFALFLETPIYSMIFVTGSLLFASALGAYCSRNWLSYKSMKGIYVVLILLIFSIVYLIEIINKFLFLELFWKVSLVVILVGLLGFFLGMPFSFILKNVGKKDEYLVAWGVALNSVSSVVGSFLCLMFVVNFGFKQSFLIAGYIYILSFLCLFFIEKRYENA